jgi:hypothetical protein
MVPHSIMTQNHLDILTIMWGKLLIAIIDPINQLPPVSALILNTESHDSLVIYSFRLDRSIRVAHDALPQKLDTMQIMYFIDLMLEYRSWLSCL